MSQSSSHEAQASKPNKIFITNLDGETPIKKLEDDLREAFEKYGDLSSVIVKRNYNGEYSYAFIEFKEGQDATTAVKNLNHTYIGDKKIRVEFQSDSRRRKGNQGCYICGKTGHFARECRMNKDDKRRRDRSNSREKKKRRRYASQSSESRSRSRSHKKKCKEEEIVRKEEKITQKEQEEQETFSRQLFRFRLMRSQNQQNLSNYYFLIQQKKNFLSSQNIFYKYTIYQQIQSLNQNFQSVLQSFFLIFLDYQFIRMIQVYSEFINFYSFFLQLLLLFFLLSVI